MSLADTYMSSAQPVIYRTNLLLYACTFVWISSKYNEEGIDVKKFNAFLPMPMYKRDMRKLEALVLHEIDWRLGFDEGMSLIDEVHERLAFPRRMVSVVGRVFMWYYIEVQRDVICVSEIVALCVMVGVNAYNELHEGAALDINEVLAATAAVVGVSCARLGGRYNRSAVAEFVEPWARNEIGIRVVEAAAAA